MQHAFIVYAIFIPQGKSNTLLITKHLKNIFETGELKEEVASSILEHTTQHGAMEGKTQETKVKYYNLMQLFLLATGWTACKHEVALALAEKEFVKYSIAQDKLFESDFDNAVKEIIHTSEKNSNKK